ncbi:MAG: hypothetical protein GXY92_10430 [Syntrophomonadaceae bacterium]|nr:hypothetical protein [Syntrophomonadaceae bacterium]
MKRTTAGLIVILALGAGFALGLLAANYQNIAGFFQQQTIAGVISRQGSPVTAETPVILEKTYKKCGHTITSEFEEHDKLMGKSMAEIQQELTGKEGYLVWTDKENETLMIQQQVDDWCPDDRKRVHLGLFKGHVAVFRGPAGVDDELLRITGIKAEHLPEQLRRTLEAGTLEYDSEDEANFVLENLDEYD